MDKGGAKVERGYPGPMRGTYFTRQFLCKHNQFLSQLQAKNLTEVAKVPCLQIQRQ